MGGLKRKSTGLMCVTSVMLIVSALVFIALGIVLKMLSTDATISDALVRLPPRVKSILGIVPWICIGNGSFQVVVALLSLVHRRRLRGPSGTNEDMDDFTRRVSCL